MLPIIFSIPHKQAFIFCCLNWPSFTFSEDLKIWLFWFRIFIIIVACNLSLTCYHNNGLETLLFPLTILYWDWSNQNMLHVEIKIDIFVHFKFIGSLFYCTLTFYFRHNLNKSGNILSAWGISFLIWKLSSSS